MLNTADKTMPILEEPSLVAQLQTGSHTAFETLVRVYGGRMLAVAQRMPSSESDAADAVQEAFASVFRAIRGFSGNSQLGTWLHRIVVNASLMKLRSRQRRNEQSIEPLLPTYLDDGHQARPATEWGESPHAAMQREETRALVRSAIDSLPDSHRTVLLLRDIEGLNTEEAAAALQIEPGAVKVRLHRARQALRTLLDEQIQLGKL
ncbi:MAG: sigma-70 family RNA polymerase sigma factor [Phycisphaerales bacterium]|nr:sigma-70 family RNA polymerase sigma factor [Phycisphaerales bacterium]